MTLGPMSGKDGSVSGGGASTQITAWSMSASASNSSWGSSSTNGYKDRLGGVVDGSGSVEGKWDGSQAMVEGTSYTLTLDTGNGSWSVPCICDSYSLDVNVDDGEVVSWSADFSIDGEYTFTAGS